MNSPRMPAMYLPHGGGPSFFMAGERKQIYRATEDFLRGVRSTQPPTPKAILLATAHWETAVPRFTAQYCVSPAWLLSTHRDWTEFCALDTSDFRNDS